jgi:hypothetical protein
MEISELFELGEDVTDSRRRHPQAALDRQRLRRHGLTCLDIRVNQRFEQVA